MLDHPLQITLLNFSCLKYDFRFNVDCYGFEIFYSKNIKVILTLWASATTPSVPGAICHCKSWTTYYCKLLVDSNPLALLVDMFATF